MWYTLLLSAVYPKILSRKGPSDFSPPYYITPSNIKHDVISPILNDQTKHTFFDSISLSQGAKLLKSCLHSLFPIVFLLNSCQSSFHLPSPYWNLKVTNDIHVANNKFSVLFIPNLITLDITDLSLVIYFSLPTSKKPYSLNFSPILLRVLSQSSFLVCLNAGVPGPLLSILTPIGNSSSLIT